MSIVIHKNAVMVAAALLCLPVAPGYTVEFGEADDAGAEIRSQALQTDAAMATTAALQAEPTPEYVAIDAEEQANAFLTNKGLHQSWNVDKKMFIAVGTAVFDSEDPSYDDTFITKRSLKTMEATLNAKASIIEFINTEMSAEDKVNTPGTNLHEKFNAEKNKLERMRDKQKVVLAKLLDDVDQTEADALRGATFGDRANAFMDAAINKLDGEFSASEVESKKKEKFEKAKLRYEESIAGLEDIEKQISAFEGSVSQELSSTVETLSKMPLFGAVTTQQFESWSEDDEQYRVALVMIWSPKMEQLARAMIQGENVKIEPGHMSLTAWLNAQNWATTTGSRRFKDDKGNAYFIGVAAAALGSSSATERRARGIAEMSAKKEVVMSIFSDVESHKVAQLALQSRYGANGKEVSQAAESFSNELRASLKNRQLAGIQPLKGTKVVHPISGQKIYVAVFGVSADSAKQALLMQESNYLTRVMDVKSQQKLKGIKEGLKTTVQAAEADQSSYRSARLETVSNSRAQTAAIGAKPVKHTQRVSSPTRPASTGPRAGVYQGAGDDSLDW